MGMYKYKIIIFNKLSGAAAYKATYTLRENSELENKNKIPIMSMTMAMEERMNMRDCMRKLALWHTRTFKPMMTHDELEPIMATKGFVSLPPTPSAGNASLSWKEYIHYSPNVAASPNLSLPRLRLPYPRIDGLHIFTYRAFLDALCFYLETPDVSDLFHIRYIC